MVLRLAGVVGSGLGHSVTSRAVADLHYPHRGAHQHQIAGGKVSLRITDKLPVALDCVGLFQPGAEFVGASAGDPLCEHGAFLDFRRHHLACGCLFRGNRECPHFHLIYWRVGTHRDLVIPAPTRLVAQCFYTLRRPRRKSPADGRNGLEAAWSEKREMRARQRGA